MSRLPTKSNVIRRLFALSGNQCAFPGCNELLVDEDGAFIGQVCHIEAAEEGGERFNEDGKDEQRRSFENLMLLCYKHHVKTNNVLKYPTDLMIKMKADHEGKFEKNQYIIPNEIEDRIIYEVINKLNAITEIVTDSKTLIEAGNVIGASTNEMTKEVLALLKTLAPSVTIASDESKIYSEQLEFIKELRKVGKCQTALDALKKFKKEKWNSISAELQFKVLANLASILFDLDRRKDAAAFLIQLEQVDFVSEDSLAYLCLAYSITGEKEKFDKISEKGELKNSENVNFWVAFIHMNRESISPKEIESSIPEKVLRKAEILFTLGELYVDIEDLEHGFKMMDLSVTNSGDTTSKKWQIQGIVASKKLTKIASPEKIAFRGFTENEIQQIKECINQLSEAWDYVSQTELALSSWHLVMNRGVSYKIIGDKINAEKDFWEAWRLANNYMTFRNLLFQYYDTNQLEKAKLLLEENNKLIITDEQKFEITTITARYYSLTNEPDEAVRILESYAQHVSGDKKLILLELITVTYFERGTYSKALPYAVQMIEEFNDMPQGYLAAGTCYRRTGDIPQALTVLYQCLDKAKSEPDVPLIWYQLGMEFYGLKKYDEAVVCLEKVLIPNTYTDLTKTLIMAYFHAGEYDKAEAMCLQLKKAASDDVTLNEILFRIYEASGRDEDTEKLLTSFLQTGKSDELDHLRLLGVKYYKRKGNQEKLRELLQEINDATTYSLLEQFIIARMMLECQELEKGLNVAYEARVNNYEKSEAHEYYIQTLVGRPEEKEKNMFPEIVSLNHAVELEDKAGTKTTYFITDDKRLMGSHILRSTDSLSQMLLNKNRGEAITMKNSVGTGNVLTISTIMNRNVFAFRDSLHLLETKFAGKSGMVFFQSAPENGFEGLKDYIVEKSIENNKQKDEIFKIYNSGGAISIGMLSEYFGRNTIELWLQMIADNSTGIICYNHDEFNDLNWVITKKVPVVLDITGLLTTIALLNKADLFNALPECIVSQSTIDVIRDYRQSLEAGPKMSIVVDGRELRKAVFGEENINAHKEWIDRILSWCTDSAKIISPKKAYELDADKSDIPDMIGKSFYDTLRLANELGAVILSDDEKFKSFALGEYGLKSFSSYQLIAQQANSKILSDEEYTVLSKILIRANYIYIPISGKDLWGFYDESGFKIQPPFTRAVRGIRILSKEYAARTISSFAKEVYLNISLSEARTYLLQYVLRVLKYHNEFAVIKPIILAVIERDFYLMPVPKTDFIKMIMKL